MLRLTPQASEHLSTVRRAKGLEATAIPRFIRRTGRLVLTFAGNPEAGDRVVDDGKVSTLVASSAADLLDDAVIDVDATGEKSVLVVRRKRSGGAAPRRRQASTGAAG